MGLIREVQGVSASLNRQERARRERERLEILQENYKKELESNLTAEFYNLYKHCDSDTAYKTAVLQKDAIIDKIYNIISKITYKQDNKKYYAYFDFDIVGDLQGNYYKILAKVKKEFEIQEKVIKNDLLKDLENRLIDCMEINNKKYCISIILQKSENQKMIIDAITSDKQKQAILKDNYIKILNKVLKGYNGDILEDKTRIKNEKRALQQKAKQKQQKKIFSQVVFGIVLNNIYKSLPPTNNKKRRG